MEPIEIGLYTSAGMLVLVLLGMRVAFAAGLAGWDELTMGIGFFDLEL